MKHNVTLGWKMLKSFVANHKIATVVAAVLLLIGGYTIYAKSHGTSTVTKYVLGTVSRGTLVRTVSGTGQVSATNQVDIKPKVSGTILKVNVKQGDVVEAGAVIASIDSSDAQKSLRNAETSYASARITYEKALQSVSKSSVQAKSDVGVKLDSAFNTMNDVFVSLPVTISEINDIFYNSSIHSPYFSNQSLAALTSSALPEKYEIGRAFDAVKIMYTDNAADFRQISRTADETTIKKLLDETLLTLKALSDVEKNLYAFTREIKSASATTTTQMTTDETFIGDAVAKSSSYISSISNAKLEIVNAEQALEEVTSTLNGTDTLDVQSAKLAFADKTNALADARSALADYTVRAPFAGVIATVGAKLGQDISSGTSAATLITKEMIATVSLNELDAAHVKVGERVTLTFDALTDFTMSGHVAEIDSIGTVSQGVVSYGVKISFDTQDEQIKPGMSVSATIIIDSKPDTLIVPSSAVKSDAAGSYVEVFKGVDASTSSSSGIESKTLPEKVAVETGISNDSEIEIVSGLEEGQSIVVRTVSGTASSATPARSGSLFGGSSNAGVRIPR